MPPEMLNPVPSTTTEFTVSAAVPEEVKVSVLVELPFTTRLPKLSVLELAVSCGVSAVDPVPLNATVVELPGEELLEMMMVPVAAPVTEGLKATCIVTD